MRTVITELQIRRTFSVTCAGGILGTVVISCFFYSFLLLSVVGMRFTYYGIFIYSTLNSHTLAALNRPTFNCLNMLLLPYII